MFWTTIGTTTYIDGSETFRFGPLVPSTYETIQASFMSSQIKMGTRDFTASPPCCFTCTFEVGAAQVYHWPTQPPEFSTLVNAAGYTL
jgi:hypothetical protein